MSGFHRHGSQPSAFNRGAAKAEVILFVYEAEIATLLAEQDPFLIAHDCIDPKGHVPVASCGQVVCAHCSRIFG